MQKLIEVITGLLALFFRPQKVESEPAPVELKPVGMSADGLAILR